MAGSDMEKRLPWWTWVVPLVMCHLGTRASLHFQIAPGTSIWYMPIALGIIMAQWWGPRVVLGVYLNALFSAGLWGLSNKAYGPLYALPESIEVFLSWFLFCRVAQGKCWLPDLRHTLLFLVFALVFPITLCSVATQTMLLAFGDLRPDQYLWAMRSGWLADMLAGLAVVIPVLILGTSWMERRGLSRTAGAQTVSLMPSSSRRRNWAEVFLIFVGALAFGLWVPVERYWYVYGVFSFWAAIRFGLGITVLVNAWVVMVTFLLPSVLSSQLHEIWGPDVERLRTHLGLAILCLTGLVTGRAITSLFDEVAFNASAREKVEESENRFRGTFEQAAVGIAHLSPAGQFLRINRRFCEIVGYTMEEMLTRTYQDITHPDDRIADLKYVEQVLDGSRHQYSMEKRYIRNDGTLVWVNLLVSLARDAAGSPQYFIAVIEDITERKQLESAFRAILKGTSSALGEEFFRVFVLELASVLRMRYVLVARLLPGAPRSVRTVAVYAQGAMADNFEYGLADTPCGHVVGHALCIYPQDVQKLFPHDKMLVEMGVDSYIGVPLYDSNGQPIGLIAALNNQPITDTALVRDVMTVFAARAAAELERILATESLRASENRYRSLYAHMAEGVALHRLVYDGSGKPVNYQLLDVNPQYEAILGVPREQVIGKLATEVYGTSEPPYLDVFMQVSETGVGRHFEVFFEPMNRHFDISVASWEKDYFATIFNDISERKRIDADKASLREQLHQAQKLEAIGQLAGGIAHDFGNLATVILGNTALLRHRLASDDELSAFLDSIDQAAQEAAGVTKSLLTFSRKLPADKKPIELVRCVQNALKLARRLLPATIELTVHAEEDPPLWVNADATQIQQILMNLVINARDAMPDGGRLIVYVRVADQANLGEIAGRLDPDRAYAYIEVTDTGCGIPEDLRRRIFEPFFSTKERGKGTGLGLAIVHGIIENHGGFIEVRSQEGVGTTFTILLPQIHPDSPEATVTVARPFVVQGHGECILLAEDNRHIRSILVSTLQARGYQVVQAEDGHTLLDRYQENADRLKLLLFDVDLPQRTGLDCLRELRGKGCTIPAILVTGSLLSDQETVLPQDTLLMRKPFQVAELSKVIAERLSGSPETLPPV